ncbi:MAG: transcription antitermination factor NusB [Lachnospiraceae bacterium]|nr:transcription antitermination factor NusB [Candidatus Fimimorpha excrementavium]
MLRRELREYTFKLLFHGNFYEGEELEEQIANFLENEEGLDEASRQLLAGKSKEIFPLIPQLDEKIAAVAKGWKLNRMGKVELTILRLALYEMLYDDQVPGKVAINEAVELAKKYGGAESPQFVNGILAKLISE